MRQTHKERAVSRLSDGDQSYRRERIGADNESDPDELAHPFMNAI
jgi:hypothetical protein